jgi:hypothetical protein
MSRRAFDAPRRLCAVAAGAVLGELAMIYPPPIDSATVAEHFKKSLKGAKRDDWPYRHWLL